MSTADTPTTPQSPLIASLVVLGLVAATYLPTALSNGFVYDDYRFVVENPHVLDPGGFSGWLDLVLDPRTTDPNSPAGIETNCMPIEFVDTLTGA